MAVDDVHGTGGDPVRPGELVPEFSDFTGVEHLLWGKLARVGSAEFELQWLCRCSRQHDDHLASGLG